MRNEKSREAKSVGASATRRLWIVAAAIAAATSMSAIAQETIEPDAEARKAYRREARPASARGQAPAPPATILPGEPASDASSASGSDAPNAPNPHNAPGESGSESLSSHSDATAGGSTTLDAAMRERLRLERELNAFVVSYGRERVERVGIPETYRAAAWRGMRDAFAREGLVDWDFLQGRLAGRLNFEARRVGRAEGRAAAEAAAEEAAFDRVSGTFRQLERDPRYDDRAPEAFGEFPVDGYYETPRLDAVFDALDFAAFGNRRLMRAFRDGDWTGRSLHACDKMDRVYRDAWADPAKAWDDWCRLGEARRWLADIRFSENRKWAETAFRTKYREAIARHQRRAIRHAWDDGWADGFDYGAFVRFEHAFRDGFARGSAEARSAAAEDAFADRFADRFDDAYGRFFDEWSSTAQVEVEEAILHDADDDGVFSPGERFVAELKLVNWGGAPGEPAVVLDGVTLARGVQGARAIPARSRAAEPLRLDLAVSHDAPVRVATSLVATIGGNTFEFPFVASWPLEFSGGPAIDALDAATGRVVVAFDVENVSRRPRAARVEVASARADGMARTEIGAGERRTVRVALDGWRGSELLDGTPSLDWSLVSGEDVQDRRSQRFPRFADDLRAPYLTEYLVALADGPGPDPEEWRRVEALVWDRIQADWRRAIRANGNPYKRDLKGRGSETEIGDWVRRARLARGGGRDLWRELALTLDARAKQLPGAHPRLRRALRKLVKQLG